MLAFAIARGWDKQTTNDKIAGWRWVGITRHEIIKQQFDRGSRLNNNWIPIGSMDRQEPNLSPYFPCHAPTTPPSRTSQTGVSTKQGVMRFCQPQLEISFARVWCSCIHLTNADVPFIFVYHFCCWSCVRHLGGCKTTPGGREKAQQRLAFSASRFFLPFTFRKHAQSKKRHTSHHIHPSCS